MYIFHVTFNQLKVFTVDFQTYQYTTSAFQYSLTVFLCTSLLFLLPIAHILKSSCNIMHNSLTDVGRTDVTSFCQGIHSFTMPNVFFFFSQLCVGSFCWDGSLSSLNMQISVTYTTLTSPNSISLHGYKVYNKL